MKNLIFLCFSAAIIIFTVIVLNNAPIINKLVGNSWYDESCQNYVDLHKYYKDKTPAQIGNTDFGVNNEDTKKEWLDLLKQGKNKCYRNKAMIGLEYAAFNFNIVFGFTCALLGLFNYLKIGNLGKIVGLIGLGSGIIGFVLTLVYIIYSGIIFTKDVVGKTFINVGTKYSDSDVSIKIRADGAFAKWDDSKKGYVCIYYDKDNEDSFYGTYSDYGNIHLNYRSKDLYIEEEKNYKFIGCLSGSTYNYATCKTFDEADNLGGSKYKYYETYEDQANDKNKKGDCDYLYYTSGSYDNKKRNIYDRWVITIVLGCFIFVLDLGLAIFGFLIFKDGGSSGSPL